MDSIAPSDKLLNVHSPERLRRTVTEDELEDAMKQAFEEVTGKSRVKMKEETHRPESWEPQNWDDAQIVSPQLWEQAMEERHNPERSPRYQHHWEQFREYMGKPDEPSWIIIPED